MATAHTLTCWSTPKASASGSSTTSSPIRAWSTCRVKKLKHWPVPMRNTTVVISTKQSLVATTHHRSCGSKACRSKLPKPTGTLHSTSPTSGRERTTHASKLAPWSSTATLPTTSLKSNKPLSLQATWSQVLACHQTRCCLVATLPTQTHSVTVLAPTSSNCQSTALSTKFT